MTLPSEMADRFAIRELMSAYADASFRGDKQAWLNCWSDDPVWKSSFGDFAGKQAMGEQWDRLWEGMVDLAFFTEPTAIEISGDQAQARCYVREIFTLKDGTSNSIIACYHDRLVRERGEWKFSVRKYEVLQRG